jgi:hypothetical protein
MFKNAELQLASNFHINVHSCFVFFTWEKLNYSVIYFCVLCTVCPRSHATWSFYVNILLVWWGNFNLPYTTSAFGNELCRMFKVIHRFGKHPAHPLHQSAPSHSTRLLLPALYKVPKKRPANTYSPWRSQLHCLPRSWITYKILRGSSPKAEVVQWTLLWKPKDKNSMCRVQWQHWLPSLQAGGLTQFLRIHCCSELFVRQASRVFNSASCLLLNIIFGRVHMTQLNRHIRCTFLMLLYQTSQLFLRLVNRFREIGSTNDKRRTRRPSLLSNVTLEDFWGRLLQ